MTWWKYVQRIAETHSPSEISRRTGIGQSSIGRWDSSSPKPESVAAFARAYGRPVVEAFIAAGFLTAEEAQAAPPPKDAAELPTDDLAKEVHRLTGVLARRLQV
ncbi:hypothetical protein OG884_06185 [Streptosporangium sp. NBC_01755]|uniref:hypothetical protein n=1 Tax=Streptosporangium sp. NBC_01755 TaxID=2975949 RepID=UPI002DDB9BF0|nr:hypothetical protein [Streptosporangium sp. NBC_01755]WSD01516.1 hypothetical protein OG884_06185 [Streptosporangium sp. NBC_01755]